MQTELSRSSTLVTLAFRGLRPHHASSTKKSQKKLALCPLQEAAALSGQALDKVISYQVLQDEVMGKHLTSLSSHQPNPFKHHPQYSCICVLHNSLTPDRN